ncbi:MAG: HDOD domain-containing protein [Oligoflexia bacterium]|nr:HDOD domain-containing protein [Oligoflexia bacterium]
MTNNENRQIRDERARARQLDRAAEYVTDYWFPINPALLEKIQGRLNQGTYVEDAALLLSDIKKDFSLFTFCLRNLILQLQSEGIEVPQGTNAMLLMEDAGLDRLKRILAIDQHDISRHDLEIATDMQGARLREVMLSASAAETLSPRYAADPDAAFSAAMLRQLGHTLIAFNYPGVYEDAIKSQKEGEELDLILARLLGFSPQMLAIKLLTSWGLSAESCAAMGLHSDDAEDEERQILGAIGETLAQICKVSEALARSADPQNYPRAAEDWQFAKHEIENKLGAGGMQLIKQKFDENCESYFTLVPHVFHAGLISELAAPAAVEATDPLLKRNPYLAHCSARAVQAIRDIYLRLDSAAEKSEKILKDFVRETIPGLGFSGGCIYTIDPGMMMLLPQTEFGELELRRARAVDYSLVLSNADIVAVAYQSNEPVVAYQKGRYGSSLTAIAGYFGRSNRVGVVYLEVPDTISNRPDEANLANFRAISITLNDCLGLL